MTNSITVSAVDCGLNFSFPHPRLNTLNTNCGIGVLQYVEGAIEKRKSAKGYCIKVLFCTKTNNLLTNNSNEKPVSVTCQCVHFFNNFSLIKLYFNFSCV